MDMNLFYLFVAAVIFVFGIFEIRRVDAQKNTFAVGLFLFVLQFIIFPFVIDFISWFIRVGTAATVPQATYLQGLFLSSIFISIYYFFSVYEYYLQNPPSKQ